ncbi:hypothetical protein V496_07968 [Pseudogymnoascus sp. VKM F-4515 (FW-2607)]|nr:hypothetical protein V496_07968 [Pseudogymnoascus sp. VKM F-4515 (FW-2607)]
MADSSAATDGAHCQLSNLTYAADSPNLQSEPLQIACIAKFVFCSADSCPLRSIERTHLLVSKSQIDLVKEKDAAVALSYTWGQFEHTKRLIGHSVDGEPVFLILGAEWDTVDITSCLVRLSLEHAGCWIDQLCMPQKEEEVRTALASIPLIYRSLDVVVLLPGAPCKCLQESLEMIQVAKQFGTEEDFKSAHGAVQTRIFRCLNFVPSCSWFTRLWTRQEMLYSKHISVAWTGAGDSLCAEAEEAPSYSPNSLGPFAQLLYHQAAKEKYDKLFGHTGWSALKEAFKTGTPQAFACSITGLTEAFVGKVSTIQTNPDNEAGRRLRQKVQESREKIERRKRHWAQLSGSHGSGAVETYHATFVIAAIDAFREYIGENEADIPQDDLVFLAILRFFSGERMTNETMGVDMQDEKGTLSHFLKSLGALRYSSRVCTQPRDYINSTWVDCPRFQVASLFTAMELPAILEDALEQLRANHSVNIVTSAPSGLFGAVDATGVWRPSLYLRENKVENAGQIYRPMIYPFKPMPVTKKGMIPLRLTGTGISSLSSTAVDYERVLSRLPTAFIFTEMINIMSLWPHNVVMNLRNLADNEERIRRFEAADVVGPALVGRALAGGVWDVASYCVQGLDAIHNAMAARQEKYQEKYKDHTATWKDNYSFRDKLVQTVNNRRQGMPDTELWTSPRELEHAEIVYSIVVDAMGLDYSICRQRGLKLMVSRNPPCIGLTNRDISAIRQGHQAKKATNRTVCVSTGGKFSGITLYEAVDVSGNSKLEKYQVFGVWVPLAITFDDRVYAIATEGATDAFII